MTNLHSEAYLGEEQVPVGRQSGLLMVKQGLFCWKIEVVFVGPQLRIVVKVSLKIEKDGFMINFRNYSKLTLKTFFMKS